MTEYGLDGHTFVCGMGVWSSAPQPGCGPRGTLVLMAARRAHHLALLSANQGSPRYRLD
jgi:hypothetical protein